MSNRILKQLLPIVFSLAVTSLCLFGAAGHWQWPNAWVLLGINFVASIASSNLLWRDPELLAERSNTKAGKGWDKPLVFVVVLLGPVATWCTAGLDFRFHWSNSMGVLACAAGVIAAPLAAVLVAWAMRSNRFFSAVVRIQKDRGQVVVTGGPYRFVRHPAYAGMCVFTLVTPLILNSRWALVPALMTIAVTALRTALEDRTLQKELEGYAAYARRVRYKLFPGIW
jgi:protein-S-isoprenylcysteine O-methyltransferase Ste14